MSKSNAPYETWSIDAFRRRPLLEFMLEALRESGCIVLGCSPPSEAPFRISFSTPWGERIGVVAYAFTANSRLTKNRPDDEHRFQVKYGSKDGELHELWQDPFGLYVTLFLGINVEQGFFVAADPVLNNPTRFFISKEFKQEHVDEVIESGWYAWERDQRKENSPEPREVLVGGTSSQFLRYVLFEREAHGEDQGHRQLLAERFASPSLPTAVDFRSRAEKQQRVSEAARVWPESVPRVLAPSRLHALEQEFALDSAAVLDLISSAPRLKMAVRGWVAERHLETQLRVLDQVASVEAIEEDGKPDFLVEMKRGRRPVLIECKNVLRLKDRAGHARLDFMRTRASQADPCSRYYSPKEFDVVAACLHASTERWEFALQRTSDMADHGTCPGKLHHRVIVDERWRRDMAAVLLEAAT